MNVADFIINFLAEKGVRNIFMITGGQAMFLNDAVFREKKIKPIFTHHEQAAGMAAEAYGRISGKLGVAMVTAGPGAINVMNGVLGAWTDSSPMMVISGQAALPTVAYSKKTKIRQYGLQGINIEPIAKPITKYFKTIDDPSKILLYMEEAYFEAFNGRKGPVWIEVPLDIQRMEVPEKILATFEPKNTFIKPSKLQVNKTVEKLYRSKRPLILAGQGIRSSGAELLFKQLYSKAKIPVITTRLGLDLIESNSDFFAGRPGLYGERGAHFAIQNADLIISIGARLDIGLIGYDPKEWGRKAFKIVVDIDKEEMQKPGIDADLSIQSDAKTFLKEILDKISEKSLPNFSSWIETIGSWRKKYPMVLPNYAKEKPVNSYFFVEKLSEAASFDDIIVVDTSSIFHVACQTWKIKEGQRFITTGGISTMGYWPAAIGACLAFGRRTIVLVGDGSLQMNIQELATIKGNRLPVKIFVINNNGYLLIRHTQKTHLGGRLMGESPKTGLWGPNLNEIAKAYELPYFSISSPKNITNQIKKPLAAKGPILCNVESGHWQLIGPRVASEKRPDGSFVSRPYEDLFPFLDEKELKENLSVSTKAKQ